MSIEDISYLKNNSIKDNIIYSIDSGNRDKTIYKNPNQYTINFDQPFKYVYGIEILDSSIPRTMYQIDKYNNKFYIYYSNNGKPYNEMLIEIDKRDYELDDLVFTINKKINDNDRDCTIKLYSLTIPSTDSSKIFISSNNSLNYPFYLLLFKSSFKETFGFDEESIINSNDYVKIDTNDINFVNIKALNSTYSDDMIINYTFKSGIGKGDHGKYAISETFINYHNIQTPGLVNLVGERFVIIRSKIIEQHFNILSRNKNSIGLGLFKLGVSGYSENRLDFNSFKPKDFHPIGKLSQIDFRFETIDGKLYDFKGVNHHFLLNIKFYSPIGKDTNTTYILNTNYNPNLIEYQKTQYEKEDYSDEELEELTNNFKKNFLEKEKEFQYESDEDLEYIVDRDYNHPSTYIKSDDESSNETTDTESSEEENNLIITPYNKDYNYS